MNWKKILSTVLMIVVALAPVVAGKKASPWRARKRARGGQESEPVAGKKKTPVLKRRRGL